MRAAPETVQVVVLARERASALSSRLEELGCSLVVVAASENEAEHAVRTARPEAWPKPSPLESTRSCTREWGSRKWARGSRLRWAEAVSGRVVHSSSDRC